MVNQRIALIREAQNKAAKESSIDPKKVTSFPRLKFYNVLATAISQAGMHLEGNQSFFCKSLNIPYAANKVALLKAIEELGRIDGPLGLTEIDGGLRCIAAVTSIGIKEHENVERFLDEIWDDLTTLLREFDQSINH